MKNIKCSSENPGGRKMTLVMRWALEHNMSKAQICKSLIQIDSGARL